MEKIRELILEEREYCEEKLKAILEEEFDSAENPSEFPEYWIGRIDQLDFCLGWIESKED